MSKYQSVEVPFGIKDNRLYLDASLIADDPYLADFVRRNSNCFEHSKDNEDRFYYYPEGRP